MNPAVNPDIDEPLLDKAGAVELLNIKHWTLEGLIRRRQIPFIKVGRQIRFVPAQLRSWLADNQVEAG